MGATGPKDVILIVDRSGSMSNNGVERMEAAKAAATVVIDSLTHTDYMSVIRFSTYAYSENTYLVPAKRSAIADTFASCSETNICIHTYSDPDPDPDSYAYHTRNTYSYK